MNNSIRLSLFTLMLTGCVGPATGPDGVNVNGISSARQERISHQQAFQSATPAMIQRKQPLITINEYSRNLIHELMALNHALDDGAFIGVTDLSFVDSDLLHGSVLSNHLSEALIYDLHKFGAPVVDFKVTNYVRVTEGGDFALSRDFTELSAELPIKYVVTGTMTKHKMGLLVNVRLVQISNKRVISVARTFIPAAVVQAILQHEADQQLQFKQG